MCVHSVLLSCEDNTENLFDLKTLFTIPLRILCRNLGIVNCGSKNKFECRRTIAALFLYQDKLETNGLMPRSHAGRLTSTLCRAINVVFSELFIESFKTVNDIKTRRDHETKNTNKHFWVNAALQHHYCGGCNRIQSSSPNDPTVVDTAAAAAANKDDGDDSSDGGSCGDAEIDSFSNIFIPESHATDPHLWELVEDPEINLLAVTQFDTDAFRKKITDLFHVRRIMREHMTASGTHDSDPWNFVEAAINKAKKPGLTKLGVYYFYVRCNDHPDLDSQFQPFLHSMLRGDTVTLLASDDENEDNEDDASLSSCSSSGFHTTTSRTSAAASSSAAGTNNSTTHSRTKKRRATKASGSAKKKTKKEIKLESAAEYQQIVASTLTQSQDDMREYMLKQDAFLGRMVSDADKKEERAKLQFRFEIAKAMGDMEEMQQLMEAAKKL